jgi:soluble lytic murein transglycosylase
MPRVAIADNVVSLANPTQAKFQAADNNGGVGGAIAAGLTELGKAGVQHAEQQFKNEAIYDEAAAKDAYNTADTRRREALYTGDTAFFRLKGAAAIDAQKPTTEMLGKIRDEAAAMLKTPRQKRMFQEAFDASNGPELQRIASYGDRELTSYGTLQAQSRQAGAADNAVLNADSPQLFSAQLMTGKNEIAAEGKLNGWAPELVTEKQHEYESSIQRKVIRSKIDSDDVTGAVEWRSKLAPGTLTADDDTAVDAMLRDPLEARTAASDLAAAKAGGAPEPGTDLATPVPRLTTVKPSGALSAPIVAGLRARGLTDAQARGVAAGIAAESANDPRAKNNEGGGQGALGIGQWRGSRQRALIAKYGPNPTVDNQLDFLVSELRGGDPGGSKVLSAADEATVLHHYVRAFMRPSEAGAQGDMRRGLSALGKKMEGTGDPSAPIETADQLDQVASYFDKEVAAGRMSPERRDRAMDRARKEMSTQLQERSLRESEADRAALDVIDRLPGNRLTDMNQLPAEVRARLSPAQRLQYEAEVERNNKPASTPADGPVAINLNDLAVLNRDQFLRTDLRKYQSQMTPDEYARLHTLQTKMIAEPAKATTQDQVWGTISRRGADAGIDMGGKRQNESDAKFQERRAGGWAVVKMMQKQLDWVTEGKRAPTEQELNVAFDQAVMNGANGVPRYLDPKLTPGGSVGVPTKEAGIIRDQLRKAGQPTDEATIARIYFTRQAKNY